MTTTRTFDLLKRYQTLFSDKPDALVAKTNGKWEAVSAQQYVSNAHAISYGLLSLGIKKGDKILSVSNNRPEWNFIDMGMAMIGAVHVPVFTSLSAGEYEYILKHSEARIIFVSDKKLLNKLLEASKNCSTVLNVFSFDRIDNCKHLSELIRVGQDNTELFKQRVEELKDGILPNDFATLIYTSGTTGVSKGVMLSHNNLVKNFLAAAEIFNMQADERYLSILPLCHVGGRMGNYQTQYSGTSIYYAENMGSIAANMKEIKPHGFDTVPRILEKIIDTVLTKGKKLKGFKKKLFFWAVDLGFKYNPYGENGLLYTLKMKVARKLVFSKWQEALGGNVKMAGCGGAALQPRLERIFWAAGVQVLNMYGLTETSPIITINRRQKGEVMLGTTGQLIDGVEVKLAADGEILCRGHNVMLGYYKDEALTKESIDKEGWFHTGDIGFWKNNKYLVITDRKKEIFKLSNGKYIAPQSIENKLKESMAIEQAMVVGDGEKFASAIISPNFPYLKDWCTNNNISFVSHEEIVDHQQVQRLINEEILKFKSEFNDWEVICRFKLVPDEWTPESGELSPTLKLKRKFTEEKYAKQISQIYMK